MDVEVEVEEEIVQVIDETEAVLVEVEIESVDGVTTTITQTEFSD